jgi:hypothetical protein
MFRVGEQLAVERRRDLDRDRPAPARPFRRSTAIDAPARARRVGAARDAAPRRSPSAGRGSPHGARGGGRLAFIAHEPLLVLLGQRGRRVAEEEGPRARRWLAATGGLAAVTGALGIALAPAAARLALALPAALAVVVALLVWRRLEKTTLGEVFVAAALASAGWAVALAGHAPAEALAAALA